MKVKSPEAWFVEWDGQSRCYAVKMGNVVDSLHRTKLAALDRIVEMYNAQ